MASDQQRPPDDEAPENGDYEVGYGKPPKHSRYKPGQSGNPNGRPKGPKNFKTDALDILRMPVQVSENGKPRKISTQKAGLLRLREKALAGDRHALHALFDLALRYNDDEDAPDQPARAAADEAILAGLEARVARRLQQGDTPDDPD